MSAVILDFASRRHVRDMGLPPPSVPGDLFVNADGSWGCSTQTMANLVQWFEAYGYDFDPTRPYEDMASDLCGIIRASTLLAHIHRLPEESPFTRYLMAVRGGDTLHAKALLCKMKSMRCN